MSINNWELTAEEKSKLSEQDRKDYETAIRYKKHDWACGSYGGWVRGNDILKKLGWKEEKQTEGNRSFVFLVKPKKIQR
ncbi:hypothetical protein [Flavobacterium frigoris]|uniref:Uncharacterized protein n=1 Tax=Flavobacterium frigoris TaxID=229204 RepID=A0A1H9LJ18_FLAFI|nr:hypothetical protein [Flavobacterium frigoris]SER11378.1 hypothetical protein SAMN05444355_10748 [Flavobacterium frigoris]